MCRYRWATIITVLLASITLGAALWRGFPPVSFHTAEFPGLVPEIYSQSKNTAVKIYKSERKLILYNEGKVIGVFKTALGFSPVGDKEKEGDGKTPEGKFVICYVNDNTPYLYFYGLNYPNSKDAKRGLTQGLISQGEYQQIAAASQSGSIPLWHTALGGEVGIHGGGNWLDWTKGCVAVSDADILALRDYLQVGTAVEIFP